MAKNDGGAKNEDTDSVREYAYETSAFGKLDVALKEAEAQGWTVVDMKQDWSPPHLVPRRV